MTDRQQGTIKKWQDDKGFGFIETLSGKSLFFHISEFKAQRRPKIGESVIFTLGQDNKGRMQARQVQELEYVQQQMAKKNSQIRKRNQQRTAQAEFEDGQKKTFAPWCRLLWCAYTTCTDQ
ncbi:cold-shock protein [Psychrobacter sp. ENNN9_III]|uniref:cold-shock protein n=1 Tax=Psychrobacter sp. ENNN9_III TaxID=1254334 RepID=UPI000AC14ECA|nr:cold shock domain-containing protein [Psychrobacter sp. ENNN9_III]